MNKIAVGQTPDHAVNSLYMSLNAHALREKALGLPNDVKADYAKYTLKNSFFDKRA